jgi:hypothetical protein
MMRSATSKPAVTAGNMLNTIRLIHAQHCSAAIVNWSLPENTNCNTHRRQPVAPSMPAAGDPTLRTALPGRQIAYYSQADFKGYLSKASSPATKEADAR